MKPKMIEPDEKIGISLVSAEREMLLGHAAMPDQIKQALRQMPPGRRKVEFTLRQVNEMENGVAQAIRQCQDNKAKRRWEAIDSKLIEIQTHYVTDDRPQDSLMRGASGEPPSRGAMVREMLTRMLEARKKGRAK